MKPISDSWFIKYKIYHLLFWLAYHYVWVNVNHGLQPLDMLWPLVTSPKFIFYVIFQAAAVYFTLYFLIPRFLERGKYAQFLSFLAITIGVAAALIASGYYLSEPTVNKTLVDLYGRDDFGYFFITFSLPSTLTSMFLAMSIKLTKNWLQSRKREQLLEKEKLENELKFLRSQMNPHFLFNSINSIFVLIHKNPDMASEALAKFSDLLRYQLYECNELEIPLSQELQYLQNYIELERLRLDNKNVKLEVSIDEAGSCNRSIAPLILIPFIENAFKHASAWIDIDLRFKDDNLLFSVRNGAAEHRSRQLVSSNGIGLKNVERRLNLIYPNEHELKINSDQSEFSVFLKISRCLSA